MGTKDAFLRVFLPNDVSVIGPNIVSKHVAEEPYVHIIYLVRTTIFVALIDHG